MELRKEISELINKYMLIRDKMLDYTDGHHDAMHWDIIGWIEDFEYENEEDIDIATLRQVVEGHQKLLDALVLIDNVGYTYC